MSYCRECGTPLEEGAQFCGECGTPVNKDEQQQVSSANTVPSSQRKTLSKRTKRLLIIGAVLIVVLFGVHKILENLFSPERLIEDFEQAILEQDAAKVAQLIHTTDRQMVVNENSVQSILKYFDRHPEQVNIVIDHLRSQVNYYDALENDSDGEYDSDEYWYDADFIRIEPTGKFLFYNRYQLMVPTVYLTVNTNYENVEISVDGETAGVITNLDSEVTFGPYFPGYHMLTGTLQTDFLELKEEKEISLEAYMTKADIDLYFDAEHVEFSLPGYNADYTAKLFVNGIDVEVNLLETSVFGPVLIDGSMNYYVEAQLPWGTVKTEEAPIDDYYISVDLMTDDLVNTLMEMVHTFNMEAAESLTTANIDNITTATKFVKDDLLYDAERDKEDGRIRQLSYLSTEFNYDSASLFYEEGVWHASIWGNSYWLEDYTYNADDEFELEEKVYNVTYEFIFDEQEKKWFINYIYYDHWHEHIDDPVDFVVEDPVTYTSIWLDELKNEN